MMSTPKDQYLAGSYSRLSQEDGDKSESDSIRNQKELIKNYLKNHPEIKLTKEYADDGYSGVSFERPDFQRMIADAKEGVINCIIVKDLSRFGRNYIEMGQYMEQILPQMGVRLIAINDNYDSMARRSPGDQILLPFKNLVNDTYCRDISMKIRSNLEAKRRKGDFVGPFCPYGYRKDPKNKNRLEIDPEAARVVQRIFQMKLDGKSNGAIAARLNTEGVRAPYEYKRHTEEGKNFIPGFLSGETENTGWSVSAILRILTNEVYVGTMVQGKTRKTNYKIKKQTPVKSSDWVRVKHTHEPVISQNEFDIVQRLLLTDTRVSPGKEEIHLFSGLLYCGNCGQTLNRRQVRRGEKRYVYYGCYSEKKKIRCPGAVIREDQLTQVVLETLRCQVCLFLDTEQLLRHADQIPLRQKEVEYVDQKLLDCEKEIARQEALQAALYGDYREGILEQDEYLALKRRYGREIKRLKLEGRDLSRKKELILQGKNQRAQYLELCMKYRNIQTLDRRTLAMLVSKIIVHPQKKLEILFTFQDEYNWMRKLAVRLKEG